MRKTTLLTTVILLFAACVLSGSCTRKIKKGQEVSVSGLAGEKAGSEMEGALKIVAVVTVKDQIYQEEVVKALRAVVEGTHTEEGNLYYEVHQDVNNPLVYVFIEVWKSAGAIDFHNQTPHFKAFVAAIDGKVELTVNTIKKL